MMRGACRVERGRGFMSVELFDRTLAYLQAYDAIGGSVNLLRLVIQSGRGGVAAGIPLGAVTALAAASWSAIRCLRCISRTWCWSQPPRPRSDPWRAPHA